MKTMMECQKQGNPALWCMIVSLNFILFSSFSATCNTFLVYLVIKQTLSYYVRLADITLDKKRYTACKESLFNLPQCHKVEGKLS